MLARPPTYPDPHPVIAEVVARVNRRRRWLGLMRTVAAWAIWVVGLLAIWGVAVAVLVGVFRWVLGAGR